LNKGVMMRSLYTLRPTFQKGAMLPVDRDLRRLGRAFQVGKLPKRSLVDVDMHGGREGLRHLSDLGDFPCGISFTPIVSRRFIDSFRSALAISGRLFPIRCNDVPQEEYVLLVVRAAMGTVDLEQSRDRDPDTGELVRPVFVEQSLPELAVFRPSEAPLFVLWSDWFVAKLQSLPLRGFEAHLAWSSDASVPPHPRAFW
jgi:hypothetical protein